MSTRTATFVGYLRDDGRAYQVRDARALAALIPLLIESGYRLGPDLLIQQQQLELDQDRQPVPPDWIVGAGAGAAAWPQLSSTDLLLMLTRPPMSDVPAPGEPVFADGGWMPPGYTWVEERLFAALQSVFQTCRRSRVELSERWARLLPHEYADRGAITFSQNRRGKRRDRMACHQEREALPATDPPRPVHPSSSVTTWYVVYLARVVGIGVPLLAAFGLSGNDTHRMALALAERPELQAIVTSWLKSRPRQDQLLMIEMSKADDPEFDPVTEAVPLVTTERCQCHVILNGRLNPAPATAALQ